MCGGVYQADCALSREVHRSEPRVDTERGPLNVLLEMRGLHTIWSATAIQYGSSCTDLLELQAISVSTPFLLLGLGWLSTTVLRQTLLRRLSNRPFRTEPRVTSDHWSRQPPADRRSNLSSISRTRICAYAEAYVIFRGGGGFYSHHNSIRSSHVGPCETAHSSGTAGVKANRTLTRSNVRRIPHLTLILRFSGSKIIGTTCRQNSFGPYGGTCPCRAPE